MSIDPVARGLASKALAAAGLALGSSPVSGGADTQILFNSGGVVNSSAAFTFSGTALRVNNVVGANAEWVELSWNSNDLWIGTNKSGTGSGRNLVFLSGGTRTWSIPTTGHFTAFFDNVYDIGTLGSNRPRTLYVGTAVVAPAAGYIKTTATTVSALPSASTAGAGARAYVSDATATTFGSTVAGGGSNKVPVCSDGTNWIIG